MKFDGPFKISQKLGVNTYRLWMPASYRIHPILNSTHLEKYIVSDPFFGEWPSKKLNHADFTESPEFEVESIQAYHWCKAKNNWQVQEFLIRFTGYNSTFDKWLTQRQLKNDLDILLAWDSKRISRNKVWDLWDIFTTWLYFPPPLCIFKVLIYILFFCLFSYHESYILGLFCLYLSAPNIPIHVEHFNIISHG